jgi:hypothetical protein
MEGSTKPLNDWNCRGGLTYRPCVVWLCQIVVLLLSVISFSFSQTSDVWIIEKPEHLVVYDVYQQSLGPGHASVIQPFEPIKVLRAGEILGDSMTYCSRVEVGDQTYYLLLNERGHLAGSALLGSVKVFRNVRFINDTVEVLRSGKIDYQEPVNKIRHVLQAGNLCVRCFSFGGLVYAKIVGSTEHFGWLQLPAGEQGKSWKVAEVQQTVQGLSPMIRDRVLKRIRQANLTLSQLYWFLDKRTRMAKIAPQWFIQSSSSSIVCTLLPDSIASRYTGSVQNLSLILQTYLLGTGYDVVSQQNKILIRH